MNTYPTPSNVHALERWRCLPFGAESPALHLAATDALLAGLALETRPAVRWYVTNTRALVLGTGQRPHEVDRAACHTAGVTVHRRASGGTAVLLEPGFLMLDVALPTTHRLYSFDVTESYRWLGDVWVTTLSGLGLRARSLPIPEARADRQTLDLLTQRVCFGGRSPYEVLVDDRKLIGFSQIRRRHGAVLQVGIYLDWHPEHIARLLAMQPEERPLLVERLTTRVAGLSDLLPAPPDASTIMDAFAATLRDTQHVTLAETDWNAVEQAARDQAAARYAPF